MNSWTPSSWQKKSLYQIPQYSCKYTLANVVNKLEKLPPLVTVDEIIELQNLFEQVCDRNAFILQLGDCAENIQHCERDIIHKKQTFYSVIAKLLEHELKMPVIKIGRIAGQFAKPRSNDFELYQGKFIPVYRGDIINNNIPDAKSRAANPYLMLRAYASSKKSLDHITDFHKHALQHDSKLFISHEALLLHYEQALTRFSYQNGKWFNLSTHFPWIGVRTVLPNSAHIEYIRGISNPIAIKVGPNISIDSLLSHINFINPQNIKGRITLIHRLGVDYCRNYLMAIIRAVSSAKLNVIWMCDPMHGNTELTSAGIKTRRIDKILDEINLALKIHNEMGTYLGGLHLESTYENVTECLNDNEIYPHQGNFYTSLCDPRLNKSQTINVVDHFCQKLSQYQELDNLTNRYVG